MDSKAALALCMWHEECLTSLEKQLAAARIGEVAAKAKVKELQHQDLQQQERCNQLEQKVTQLQHKDLQQQERCNQLEQKVQLLTAEFQASQSELTLVLNRRSVQDVAPPRLARVMGMAISASCRQIHVAANALKDFSCVNWSGDAIKVGSVSMCFENFVGEQMAHMLSSDLKYDTKTGNDYLEPHAQVITRDMEENPIAHLSDKLGNTWTAHLDLPRLCLGNSRKMQCHSGGIQVDKAGAQAL